MLKTHNTADNVIEIVITRFHDPINKSEERWAARVTFLGGTSTSILMPTAITMAAAIVECFPCSQQWSRLAQLKFATELGRKWSCIACGDPVLMDINAFRQAVESWHREVIRSMNVLAS